MRKGFTLAEVLITIALIAVIAALTLPTLVKEFLISHYIEYKMI